MNIGCTEELLDEMKLKATEPLVESSLFSWHGKYLTLVDRKAVILVNDLTHYCVLLLGLNEQDFSNLGQLAISAIEESFLAEGIAPEIVAQYLQALGEVTFTSTSDSSVLAVMNRFVKEVGNYQEHEFNLEKLNQVVFSLQMGNWDVNKIDGEYECPQETLHRELAKFANVQTPVSVKAFQFHMSLALPGHEVWRKVIVPGNIDFHMLHLRIQTAFGWQGDNFYGFTISKDGQPVANIASTQSFVELETQLPSSLASSTKVTDYLPEHEIKYIYDFIGDRWEHSLKLEEIIENYPHNYPTCIEAKGNCPPEDVGGMIGYNTFLHILNNPQHPAYEETVDWGKKQGYKEFNIDWANNSLRYAQYLNRRIMRPKCGPLKRVLAVK